MHEHPRFFSYKSAPPRGGRASIEEEWYDRTEIPAVERRGGPRAPIGEGCAVKMADMGGRGVTGTR